MSDPNITDTEFDYDDLDALESLPEFSGTPETYKRIAALFGFGIAAYLYLGMFVINYLILDKSWILGWVPISVAILFGAFCARFTYMRIMLLDAQFGSGKGWELQRSEIALPRRRERPKNK